MSTPEKLPTSLRTHLGLWQRTFLALERAASDLALNQAWLEKDGSREVRLLDFDVICGSLHSTRFKRLNSVEQTHIRQWEQHHIGPKTLRLLLNSQTSVVLPLGTLCEAFCRLSALRQAIPTDADRLLKQIHTAVNEPASQVFNLNPGQYMQGIRDSVSAIGGMAKDYELLSKLIDCNVSIDGLDDLRCSTATLRSTAQRISLERKRDRPSSADELDAINLQSLASIYRRKKGQIPVLISESPSIVGAVDGWQQFLNLPQPAQFSFLHNRFYLCLSASAEVKLGPWSAQRSQYRIVETLAADCRAMTRAVDELLKEAEAFPQDEYIFSVPRFKSFRSDLGSFFRTWKWLLEPFYTAIEADWVDFINMSLSPNLDAGGDGIFSTSKNSNLTLSAGYGDLAGLERPTVEDLKRFRADILREWASDRLLRGLIIDSGRGGLNVGADHLLKFHWICSANRDLAYSEDSCKGWNPPEKSDFCSPHDIRLSLTSPLVPNGQRVLEASSEMIKGARRWITLSWSHCSLISDVFDHVSRFVKKLNAIYGDPVDVRVDWVEKDSTDERLARATSACSYEGFRLESLYLEDGTYCSSVEIGFANGSYIFVDFPPHGDRYSKDIEIDEVSPPWVSEIGYCFSADVFREALTTSLSELCSATIEPPLRDPLVNEMILSVVRRLQC
jgi:hypothetical protein